MATIRVKGGDRLNAALGKILQRVKGASSVAVGFQNGATEKDGTSVALVAAINEYGAPSRGQPPRPFFRNMIAAKQDTWPDILAGALKDSNFDGRRALGVLGQRVMDDLQESIRELTTPPLAPSTIAKKSRGGGKRRRKPKKIAGVLGPAKPLIDSATMLRSITAKVS